MGKRQTYSRGDSFKYFAANRRNLAQCRQIRQGDELFCPICGVRWGVQEDKPPCGRVDQ